MVEREWGDRVDARAAVDLLRQAWLAGLPDIDPDAIY